MRKGKVFFHPIDGSGALTISWSTAPKGNAIEAEQGSGVGFFSESGDLLCVIFDEVKSDHDHQLLEFESGGVELTVKHGKVAYNIAEHRTPPHIRKRRSKQRQATR